MTRGGIVVGNNAQAPATTGKSGRFRPRRLSTRPGVAHGPRGLQRAENISADIILIFERPAADLAARQVPRHSAMGPTRRSSIDRTVQNRCMKIFPAIFQFWHRVPSSLEILEELTAELWELRRSERHVWGLRGDLMPFVRQFPRIEKVTEEHVSLYIRCLATRVGPRRRDNVLLAIRQFSKFCRRRGYLQEEKKSAAEKVRLIRAPSAEPAIWTISETRSLIDGVQHVAPDWLPVTLLGLFAGLRTSECLRLEWSSVLFPQRAIRVSRGITKTRTARVVPISENLFAWLEPYQDRAGLIRGRWCEKTAENLLSRAMVVARKEACLPRKNNAARHSYASFRLSLVKSFEILAAELGNSPRMLRQSYVNARCESEGNAYFGIFPGSSSRLSTAQMELFESA